MDDRPGGDSGGTGFRARSSKPKNGLGRAAAVAGGVVAVLVVAGLTLASCGDNGGSMPWGGSNAGGGGGGIGGLNRASAGQTCPRPPSVTGGEFNAQESDIRALRRAAFRGDFFAQLELGTRYSAARATDRNIEDPVESAVWYAMALANDDGYSPINSTGRGGWRPVSRFDDCRAWERRAAYQRLDRLLGQMTRAEQEAVRDRVIYVLSTQDAQGFRTLARLHDSLYGPFGEPQDNRQAREAVGNPNSDNRNRRGAAPLAVGLFQRNDVDAYLYNYLAVQTGDVGAYVMLKDFEQSGRGRARYGAFVEAKARQWTPPFEFYPNTAPRSGVPFSDESRPRGDAWDYAVGRMTELPFIHVGRALRFIGVVETAPSAADQLTRRQIETLEAMLGRRMDGRLDHIERLRAIQMAAVNGSADAQLVLAVMYAEGIGTPIDNARAFYWFDKAAQQGNGEARFAMSTYFALGVAGVADQDKAQAVVMRIESALDGFGPTAHRLRAVLAQVSRSQRR